MRWNAGVAGLATSWGFISILAIASKLPASAITVWRMGVGAAAVGLALTAVRRLDLLRVTEQRGWLAATGVGLAAHWWCYFEAMKLSNIAVANFTVYTAPIFLAVLAPLVLPERRSLVALAALVPGGAGLVLIALAGNTGGGHVRPLAVAVGLAGAATYACLVIATKRLTRTLSPIAITFWNGVVGAVALSPLLLTADRIVPHGIRLLYVLLLGAVFTGLSGFVYVWLLSHVTAQAIGILSYIEPVSAALLAWALLGQGLGWQVGLGGVLVVGAGLLIVFFEPVDAPPLEAATVGSPRESAGRRDAVGGHPPPRRA